MLPFSMVFTREINMQIWLDSANVAAIHNALRFGFIFGITTNPSIISQNNKSLKQTLKDLLTHQEGPIAVQITSKNVSEMVQEGQYLYDISERIMVKVPVTEQGFEAIYLLTRRGIPTIATVVFTPLQVLFAAQAGAFYVAPYVSHIEKQGENVQNVISSMQKILADTKKETKILAASLNTTEQIQICAELGVEAITLKETMLDSLLKTHPLTQSLTTKFEEDSKKIDLALSK